MIETISDLRELQNLYEEEHEKALTETPPMEVCGTHRSYLRWVDTTSMQRAKDRMMGVQNDG